MQALPEAELSTAVSDLPVRDLPVPSDERQASFEPMIADETSTPLLADEPLLPLIADITSTPLVIEPPKDMPQHSSAIAPVPRGSWLFAIGVIYAVGVVLVLTRIVVGIFCTLRLVHRALPVNVPLSVDQVPTSARVFESDEVLVPVTLGLWWPVIVLPIDWNTWSDSQVQIAVAHEAEHLRRRDTLVGLLTAVNVAVYWFHPVVWLLRCHMNDLAEQACDDEVIRTTGQRAEYAQVLVNMASRLAFGAARYQPTGIGMASKPLVEKRVMRILNDKRTLTVRPGRVHSLLLASLITAATIVTAALSAAPVLVATQEDSIFVITGRVTDEAGNGLGGAKLWLNRTVEGEAAFEATADALGHYSLSVPASAIRPTVRTPFWVLWCYSSGRQIGTEMANGQMHRMSDKPLNFKLQPDSGTEFVVQTADGNPVSGALVELIHTNNRTIPKSLRKIIGAKTDTDGRVQLPAVGQGRVDGVQITDARSEVQQFRLNDDADESVIRTISLRPTGRLEGRLISDNLEVTRSTNFRIFPVDEFGSFMISIGEVTVDDKGQFVVPELADGDFRLVPNPPENPAISLRPRVPSRVEINAGETTRVEIPFEPTVRVRGRVQTKDNSQPVKGASLILSIHSWTRSEVIQTDADGRFELNVVPGKVQQHLNPFSLPSGYADWASENPLAFQPFQYPVLVPGDVDTFDLPPIELIPTERRAGLLLDNNKLPIPNVKVTAISGNRMLRSFATTDDQGNFHLSIPRSVKIKKYSVAHYSQSQRTLVPAFVVTESPLTLQIPPSRAGTLMDQNNQPIAHARISAYSLDGMYHDFATTDDAGNFQLFIPDSVQIDRYVIMDLQKDQITKAGPQASIALRGNSFPIAGWLSR